MTSADENAYKADDDATELDRHLMALARNLHEAGWIDQAEDVAHAATQLRETWSSHVGDTQYAVYDALGMIRDSADQVIKTMEQTLPGFSDNKGSV